MKSSPDSDPLPEASAPSETPEPSKASAPSETPEPSKASAPSEAPEPSKAPEPSVADNDADESESEPPSKAKGKGNANAKATTKAKAKTKKRRRRAEPDSEPVELDENGRERPRFLLAFPEHPELAKLSRAFEAGNYAYVREHALDVAERAEDDEVRSAALELAERIKPDPLIKYLLLLSAALLVYLVIHVYGNHAP